MRRQVREIEAKLAEAAKALEAANRPRVVPVSTAPAPTSPAAPLRTAGLTSEAATQTQESAVPTATIAVQTTTPPPTEDAAMAGTANVSTGHENETDHPLAGESVRTPLGPAKVPAGSGLSSISKILAENVSPVAAAVKRRKARKIIGGQAPKPASPRRLRPRGKVNYR